MTEPAVASSRPCSPLPLSPRSGRWLAAALWLWGAAGCGGTDGDPLAVFAASSLTDAFEAVEQQFEAANPGTDVVLTFAGSQVLRLQIEQSAPADVFASANEGHLRELVSAGLVARTEAFAHNALVIIVPPQNPAGIESLADLPKAQRLVLGTPEVPVGAYTQTLLTRAEQLHGEGFADRVQQRVVSLESNVRLVRAKVELGEADAAIVYRTDAIASDKVRTIELSEAEHIAAGYFVGTVARSQKADLGQRFVAYLHSPAGRDTLAAQGFSPPS